MNFSESRIQADIEWLDSLVLEDTKEKENEVEVAVET